MAFKPGQSGNPNGAPKRIDQSARMARLHTEKAIETLVAEMSGEKAETRIKASVEILNRGWGKPQEHVEITGDENAAESAQQNVVDKVLSLLSTDALKKLSDELKQHQDSTTTH